MRERFTFQRAPIGVHLGAMVGACLVSLAVIIGYSSSSAFVRERARATAQVGSTAQFAAAGVASQLGSLPTFLQAIAAEPAVTSFDPATWHGGVGDLHPLRPGLRQPGRT